MPQRNLTANGQRFSVDCVGMASVLVVVSSVNNMTLTFSLAPESSGNQPVNGLNLFTSKPEPGFSAAGAWLVPTNGAAKMSVLVTAAGASPTASVSLSTSKFPVSFVMPTPAPAAAVPADAENNAQSDPSTRARLMAFNGMTWDRIRSAQAAITATITGMLNTLPMAAHHTAPTVRTNGQFGPLESSANGSLVVADEGGHLPSLDVLVSEIDSIALNYSTAVAQPNVGGFGNVVAAGATYNASPATRVEGLASGLQSDIVGNLKTTLATSIAGEDRTNNRMLTECPHAYQHLTTGTTVVKTGPGTLHGVTINTKAAGAGTLTIYDNTAGSGAVIGVIDLNNAINGIQVAYNLAFTTGLTLVFTVAADVTITYN